MLLRLAFVLTVALAATTASPAKAWRVTVSAADVDRAGIVASFPMPAGLSGAAAALRGAAGLVPVQVDAQGHARFILPLVKAGETPVFTLESASSSPALARADTTESQVKLSLGGRPVLEYWTADEPLPNDTVDKKFLRSGHLHPIRTPAGAVITASYPANHLHHHGIWAPWTKTEFQGRTPDFWNMGQLTGKVEFAGLDLTWSGPVHAGFVARQRHVDLSAPTPVVALDETWTVTLFSLPGAARPVHVFDLVMTQTCATDAPLRLPTYHYGGLGFRGHDQWNGADRASFLTSEGVTDRIKGNTSRARWLHVGGTIDRAFSGLGILGHPGNFRAPQPLRLHPNEPFVAFAPSQLGDWEITPGQTYVARYRFVVTDGPADRDLLEAYWQGYAHPVSVTVERD